jgi:pimeloyl-ACP methyl ester carboxylesterase
MFSILNIILSIAAISGNLITDTSPYMDHEEVQDYYTIEYADGLFMDFYSCGDAEKPIVLFVHGGGFSKGSRDHPLNQGFCEIVQQYGYNAASISYTLYLEKTGNGCNVDASEKRLGFEHCVADIWTATNYALEKRDSLQHNGNIILAGSSAGAEGILHAAYWTGEDLTIEHNSLPQDFKYGGLISMAGAMLDTSLVTAENCVPTLFAHGTCDNLVPFGSANHRFCKDDDAGALPLHGAGSITKRMDTVGGIYMILSECGAGHEVANTAMIDRMNYVDRFLNLAIMKGAPMQQKHTFKGLEPCDLDPEICR